MKITNIIVLAIVSAILGNIYGCASNNSPRKRICDDFAVPSSNIIYLFVSSEYEPPESVVQVVKNKTTYSLLRVADDVKIINTIEENGYDGFVLKIDIINIDKSIFARRIDIRYSLIENATKTEVLSGKDAMMSRQGYNGAAEALGQRISKRISQIFRCFDIRRKELSP